MPSYKVTYFDRPGMAESIRLMFALAGEDFNDNRVTQEQWVELKPKTRFGQMPILEIDGKEYVESRACITYLAREFGYFGTNNLEALEIDQALSMIEDFTRAAIRAFFAPDDKKEEVMKAFKDVESPKCLAKVEKVLKENGTGYCVGSSVTVADVVCADFTSRCNALCPGLLEAYPLIRGLITTFDNLDNIKAYREKRPAT